MGTRTESRLLFTPLLDDPRFDLKKGEAEPAVEVLKKMVPFARKMEDVPT